MHPATRLLFPSVLLWLVIVSSVRGDGWDDFSNNLATDLTPFLSLFGEQITKQYLSESITLLDYFIFAMAPMGILTAVVSAIRVCGGPSLRAFIGRAQEGSGTAEAELCSSTSRDVCELYNNGGIARVFGRPKILEIVFDPKRRDFSDGTAGIYPFREYVKLQDQEEWEGSATDAELAKEGYAPNLSLNIGIKSQSGAVFWSVALLGIVLQGGVLAFAIIITYNLKWNKGDSPPELYACPLTVIGTILVCSGIFLCAFFIGQSTHEERFQRNLDARDKLQGRDKGLTRSHLFWIQPGRQVLGDQIFDAFCYSDEHNALQQYISSGRIRTESWAKKSKYGVWWAVCVTVVGFVLQFTGLRAIHSAVAMSQLGATLLMSACRAALRMQRLKPDDNYLRKRPDEVVGHELDWLAMHLGQVGRLAQERFPVSTSATFTLPFCYDTDWQMRSRNRPWNFAGLLEPGRRIHSTGLYTGNPASMFLAYRRRLAQLTTTQSSQQSFSGSSMRFDDDKVAVREESRRLTAFLEFIMNVLYSQVKCITSNEEYTRDLHWRLVIAVSDPLESRTIDLRFTRDAPRDPWRVQDRLQFEAVLGLWAWSLKSDPAVEITDIQNGLILSRASEIPTHRIFATRLQDVTSLHMWRGETYKDCPRQRIGPLSPLQRDPSVIWEVGASGQNYTPFKAQLPESLDSQARLFGWYTIGSLMIGNHKGFDVWTLPTNVSLLSLCSQELIGSFLVSIADIVDDFGAIGVKIEHTFKLENALISKILRGFVDMKMGSLAEAELCVLPAIVPHLRVSSVENALLSAERESKDLRKRNQWDQGEQVLWWAWDFCQRRELGNSHELIPRAILMICEFYRWALRGKETFQLGHDGILVIPPELSHCHRGDGDREKCLSTADTILKLYTEVLNLVKSERNKMYDASIVVAIENGLAATLAHLTIVSSMPEEQMGLGLCLIAEKGWTEAAGALIELGANPDFRNPTDGSRNALSYAAQHGNVAMVKELLKGGADPSLPDESLKTPLSYARDMLHIDVIALLLMDRRVNSNASDPRKCTPIFWAVSEGHLDLVKHLLRTGGIELNAQDSGGQTLLALAAQHGQDEVVQLLIDTENVDFELADRVGFTPLTWAARTGHDVVVKRLLGTERVDPDPLDYTKRTPLLWAVIEGHEAAVEALLATNRVDPNIERRGWMPLVRAAKEGYTEIVKLLLETGKVDPNARECYVGPKMWDYKGQPLQPTTNEWSPIGWATMNGHAAVVNLLLETGEVDPKQVDKNGDTLAQLAARNGHGNIVTILQEYINRRDGLQEM